MPEDAALLALIEKYRPKARAKADGGLVPRLLTRAAQLGARLWRNQVGSYKLADGRWISSGLCVGSGDLIGYVSVTITADMVGQTLAQFVSVEAKAPRGRLERHQAVWLERCRADGAIAVCVRTVEELESALREQPAAAGHERHPRR